jgi:hypothetical protein
MSDGGKVEKPQLRQDQQEKPKSDDELIGGTPAGAGIDGVLAERRAAASEAVYRATGGTAGDAPGDRMAASKRALATDVQGRLNRMAVMRKAQKDPVSYTKPKIPEGGGTSLPGDVREKMEPRLGADLSRVRVHTGGDSQKAAGDFGARAFTVGDDVHFNAGEFKPGTKDGDHLIAHELTHVVQGQKSGIQRKAEPGAEQGGDHADAHGGEEVSKPGQPAEQEADAVADEVSEDLHDGKPEKAEKGDKSEKGDGEHGDEAGGEKKPAKEPTAKAPAIGAKLEPGAVSLAKKGDAKAPAKDDKKKKEASPETKQKRYVIKAERKGGKEPKKQTLQGTREDVTLALRQLQLAQEDVTAKDIVGMGNLAMGSLEVTGSTPGGIIAKFNLDIGKAGLLTIFSSGSGASVEKVDIPVVDGSGKPIKSGKLDPQLEKAAGQIILSAGEDAGAPKGGPAVQVATDAEQKKFLEEATSLVENRGYVPTLDKHSEAALWQAVRLEDAKIADQIKSLGLAKITAVTMKIFSEREMCGQCAAKSAEMMGNLKTHAKATWEAIQFVSMNAKLGTEVDSTHNFGANAAKQAPEGQKPHPNAPVVNPPSGKSKPSKNDKKDKG